MRSVGIIVEIGFVRIQKEIGNEASTIMLAPLPYRTGGFADARIDFVVILWPRPRARKGTSRGTSDCISHHTSGWALHFLPRGWAERCANASSAARPAIFVADVRPAVCSPRRSLSPGRARLSRLRAQRLARPQEIRVHVRSHRRGHESLHGNARL